MDDRDSGVEQWESDNPTWLVIIGRVYVGQPGSADPGSAESDRTEPSGIREIVESTTAGSVSHGTTRAVGAAT
jgi:hypothetical protein